MADSLLGQLSELATPQVLDQISKMTGVDTQSAESGHGRGGRRHPGQHGQYGR